MTKSSNNYEVNIKVAYRAYPSTSLLLLDPSYSMLANSSNRLHLYIDIGLPIKKHS